MFSLYLPIMKRMVEYLKNYWGRLRNAAQRAYVVARRYVSPAFVVMFVVAFTLWYISKLTYTYTTDFNIRVEIDGQTIELPCVVEGKGTNLVSYGLSSRRIKVPLSELKYELVDIPTEEDNDASPKIRKIRIDRTSLRNAISVRFSDIKVQNVGTDDYIYLD